MKIKCERCGKIFNSKTIKRRYCDDCVKIQIKNNNVRYLNKKYANDDEFAEKLKNKKRDKFIFDNYYGLILGTTNFGGHRKHDFKKEAEVVRKEKYRVLNGKTYTDKKYLDLYDENITKTNKSGTKKRKDDITIPPNINNFDYVDKMIPIIMDALHIESKRIYGVLKVELDSFDKYILYCRVKGRITENVYYTKKDLYV